MHLGEEYDSCASLKLSRESFGLSLKSINNSIATVVFQHAFECHVGDLVQTMRKIVQDNLNVIFLSIICMTEKDILLYQLNNEEKHYTVSLLEPKGSRTYIISVKSV